MLILPKPDTVQLIVGAKLWTAAMYDDKPIQYTNRTTFINQVQNELGRKVSYREIENVYDALVFANNLITVTNQLSQNILHYPIGTHRVTKYMTNSERIGQITTNLKTVTAICDEFASIAELLKTK